MKKLYYTAFFYAILGLVAGVFYREVTKHSDFTGDTILVALHTHILALGFLFFLILLVLSKLFLLHESKSFTAGYFVYNAGMLITLGAMTARGLLQMNGTDIEFLPHIAGLGHTLIGAGFIWFMILLRKKVI